MRMTFSFAYEWNTVVAGLKWEVLTVRSEIMHANRDTLQCSLYPPLLLSLSL